MFASKHQQLLAILHVYVNACEYTDIYIYMVTPPPRAYLQEGVYHICICIFIFQIVAHAKTTVNTNVFWIHYM